MNEEPEAHDDFEDEVLSLEDSQVVTTTSESCRIGQPECESCQ